jgi:hypothetical protein
MPVKHALVQKEASLSELLADPIVQMVMARDGITKDEVERLLGAVRAKLAGPRRGGTSSIGSTRSSVEAVRLRLVPDLEHQQALGPAI